MIVDNLDVMGIAALPSETDPPLIIDAATMLALALALQRFKPIARRHGERLEERGGMDLHELAQRDAPDIRAELARRAALKDLIRPVSLNGGTGAKAKAWVQAEADHFLFDVRGPWAESRESMCANAGVDPDVLRREAGRRLEAATA